MAFACLALTAAPAAASDASGIASAVVLKPLALTNLAPLDFGTLESQPEREGTATIDPIRGDARYTGGARAACAGADCFGSRPALFAVEGEPGRNYRIVVPPSIEARIAGLRMRVDGFLARSESLPGSAFHGRLDKLGKDRFSLGATLHVPAGAPAVHAVLTVPVSVSYE